MKKKAILNLGVIVLALLLGLGAAPLGAAARSTTAAPRGEHPQNIFTVDSDGDSPDEVPHDHICADSTGKCTLRAAIQEANSFSDSDIIVFASPMHIYILTPLTSIIQPTTIDASSVWDTGNDAPGVIVDGVNKSFGGIYLDGSESTVRGLHIINFDTGITIYSSYNHVGGTAPGQRNVVSLNKIGIRISGSDAQYNDIQGNWIGLSLQGDSADPNTNIGVFITDGAAHNTIGGTEVCGNYISGNGRDGVQIRDSGSHGNRLGGNVIGLGADDQTPLGNERYGVWVTNEPQETWVGGGGLAGNEIAYSSAAGVYVQTAYSTTIQGNLIWQNYTHGVHLEESAGNRVVANAIARNALDGVHINGSSAILNLVTANSIFDNGGLGINLQAGGNGELPAPVITIATPDGAGGNACPGCTVEVFSDQEDEGHAYHGSTTADGSGHWSYTGAIAGPNATATNRDSQDNTSEFSAPISVTQCTPVTAVTIGGPTGGLPGLDICFNAAVSPAGATPPIGYAWSTDALANGQGTSAACYNWAQPGTYQVAITATNCGGIGQVQATHTITIVEECVAISFVDIGGPSAGQAGAAVCFTTALDPANASAPVDYLWSPAPGSGQGTPSTCYTWAAPGTYVITVTASNCNGAGMAHDTHTVTISADCIPVTGAAIAGPGSGLLGVLYSFSAAVTPTNATPPLSYIWTPPPGSGQGSANVHYTWAATGTFTLSVAVSNCGGAGAASGDHAITISAGTVWRTFLPVVMRHQ